MSSIPKLVLAVLVALVAASIIRDNARVANSRIAAMLDPLPSPPVTPAPLPDLVPVVAVLSVHQAAMAGPATAFAVAMIWERSPGALVTAPADPRTPSPGPDPLPEESR